MVVRSTCVVSLLLALAMAPATGQCTHSWRAGFGYPGVTGTITAIVAWDPDGGGPLPVHAAVGGDFWHAGTVAAGNLAAWNPVTGQWLALPATPFGIVSAIAVSASGELVVALQAEATAPAPRARIVSWNGASWTVLGIDFDQPVRALHVRPNGELVAGGSFAPFGGGTLLGGLVAWSGTAWLPLGGGVAGEVNALASMPNGDLLAGGSFQTAGGVAASNVARWNGVAWSALGTGSTATVTALAPAAANRVFAGTATNLVEWNGASWSIVPGLVGVAFLPTVAGLALLPGRLVVAGVITSAGTSGATGIASLDLATGTWSALGAGFPAFQFWAGGVGMLALNNGDLLFGAYFGQIGAFEVASIARWDGASWHALTDGPNSTVTCLAPIDDATFAVGGSFANVGNVPAARVARWDGTRWQALGAGLAGPVDDLEVLPNGDLLAAGSFQASGAIPARALARWDGIAWSEFGGVAQSGGPGAVVALEALPNGDLVVAGNFSSAGSVPANHVAVWRGGSWSPLGIGLPAAVQSFARVGTLGLVALTWTGEIREWDGVAWSLRASYGGQEYPALVGALGDGTLIVSGTRILVGTQYEGFLDVFLPSHGFPVRYLLGVRQFVTGLVPLPDGTVLATNGFAGIGGSTSAGAARVLPGGLLAPSSFGTFATTGRFFPGGDLLLGGVLLDSTAAVSVGRLGSTCPAAAAPAGTGCTGSGGPNVLAATALPWLGSTFRARATGMPALGVAIGVRGLTAGAVPLSSVLPQAGPGCDLLVAPDLLDTYVPIGGSVATQLAIPNTAALVGAMFHEQVVVLDLAGGTLAAATSTNRLTITLGVF